MSISPAPAAVLLERIGEYIAVATLNRPEARNAINGAVREEAIALLRQVTANAPLPVRESLHVARRAADLSEKELIRLTRKRWQKVSASEDYREGPRAFIEKRAPRWTGR
jgi:enoyl-CoA hydratase/carnithine racemase